MASFPLPQFMRLLCKDDPKHQAIAVSYYCLPATGSIAPTASALVQPHGFDDYVISQFRS